LHKKADIAGRKRRGKKTLSDSSSKFEKLIEGALGLGHYSLRLYISGSTPRSTRAVANIRSLCDKHLPGRYDLEVIDIYQQPEDAVDAQIIAAPTLVKLLPKPLKRFIGNLSNPEKLLVALRIRGDAGAAAA